MTAASTKDSVEQQVRELYLRLLDAWNKRNARDFALLFEPDGAIVGFDGSQVFGQTEIGAHVSEVFSHHQTARYVSIVRRVRQPSPDTAILSAVVGMVPPGKDDINPGVNAVQTLIAVRRNEWQIALFQNTPAQFHGRPDEVESLTKELRGALETN
jgi:uncharacterized protein (TIGR02246 family)